MKLLEVRQIASERLNVLRQQREKLINMTKENVSIPQNNINFDRVEISKAISDIDKEYEQISDIADKLSIMDAIFLMKGILKKVTVSVNVFATRM